MAILAATRALFREGAGDVKISGVAGLANVAEGTVYLYFKNKSALLAAAVGDFYSELTRDAQACVYDKQGTVTKLYALARLHFDRVQAEWPLISEAMGPSLASPRYRESEAYALNRRYVEVFNTVVRDGVTCGDIRGDVSLAAIRDVFYGGLEHCARSARLRPEETDAVREVDTFMMMFTGGIMGDAELARQSGPVDGTALIRQLRSVVNGIERQMIASGNVGAPQADTDKQNREP